MSRPALRPTQLAIQLLLEVISLGLKRGMGVTLTCQPYYVPRSRMIRRYISSPLSACIAVAGQLSTALLLNFNVCSYRILVKDVDETCEFIKNIFSVIALLGTNCVGIVSLSNRTIVKYFDE
jgi:hypothetical protein